MQQIPPLGFEGIASQLVVTGRTPHIRLHTVLLSKNALGAQCLIQDWTASEELHRSFAARPFKLVDSAKDAFSAVFGHRRHGIIFVVKRKVIENIFSLLIHAP